MIKLKITLPLWLLLFLLPLILLVWLSRDPVRRQPRPAPRPAAPAHAARPSRRPRPSRTVIVDADGHDTVSFAEAIRAPLGTFTDDEIEDIANREILEVSRQAYDELKAESDEMLFQRLEPLRNWRTNHVPSR